MKVKFLSWTDFQKENQKQTAVVINYDSDTVHKVRVLLNDFLDRDTAWAFCKQNCLRNTLMDSKKYGETFKISIKLYRLSKLTKLYSETKPQGVSAMRIISI